MRWRRLGPGLLILLWLGGCAKGGGLGYGDTLSVGQREEELVARQGQPQEVQPGPGKGKIYIYTTYNLDQVAAMGGGAWGKPDQVYYWLDDQGIITRVVRYPYGKRKFIFPTKEKPTEVARAPVPPEAAPAPPASPTALKAPEPQPAPAPALPEAAAPPKPASPVTPGPAAASQPPVREPAGPGVSPTQSDMAAATRLELNMSREDVRQVLGSPERTEGFRAKGRGVIVWFYLLENQQGRRVLTPLVFEEGRLSGWGENHYQRRLREVSSQEP